MESITCFGFCEVAALSKYTKEWPFTFRERIGKSWRIFRTSTVMEEFILKLKPQTNPNFIGNQLIDSNFQFGNFYAFQNRICKGVHQKCTRFFQANAAASKVEQSFLIKLSDSTTVRAFYVIRKNFQLGFCVYRCFIVN